MTTDPLLHPYRLKHLTFKNRLMSTAHEPAYSEEGLPKERYRLYHAEKAKGGIAMTMTAGSAIVSRDSPAAFGNLQAYRDEIVPWLAELAEACRKAGQYQEAENAYSRAIELKGPMQTRAARALSEVQMTRRAAPGTQVGIRVAEVGSLTRADLCALLIDELKVEELVEKQRKKTYDTGFQPPGDQTQDGSTSCPGDIEGHWAKAWIEQTLALDLPGLGLRSDGLFGPDDAVKRKDLAQVLQGLLVLITKDGSLVTKYVGSESRFPDVRSDVYYYNAAALAVGRGLMRVDALEGTFGPERTVSGAEALLAIKDLKEALMTR